ncbi:NAD(P) transhydrogenase subunit alpha [Glaciecola sp. SC05]|uniref:NAD(P) transhydrogenase subunit alpha n=1 Tax=Glaciecola sp. SC05 TaxID=1987355 RepID=UPI003528A9AC
MSILVFTKEGNALEKRCALLPENAKAYKRLGATVLVQSGLGESVGIADQEYIEAGAEIFNNRKDALTKADAVLSVDALSFEDFNLTPQTALSVSFFDPFNHQAHLNQVQSSGRSMIAMEMVPRISRCQKMDALSSQASLAGYVMVLNAMSNLNKTLPMMMTPAGTLKPAKVFIIGAGVAGLQAIATAKRMGASVIAYDTREEVAQQVQSLGAKFLQIDLGKTESTAQGYAKALTPEQLLKQQEAQAQCIADSDIVITTAQLFGRKPPVLITNEVINRMKPGSVIVDMAAQDGGNVEASVAGEIIDFHGVKVIGTGNWASQVALDASQMYGNNLQALIQDMWDAETQSLVIDDADEVLNSALLTHKGNLVNPIVKAHYAKESA